MGVKGLWILIASTCKKKSLWELKDQTIAIDLSGWICENQNVLNYNTNLYLRNLFFRTSYLLLLGIKPIFILDGKAPHIKLDVIEQRRKIQGYNSTNEAEHQQKKRTDRSHLNSMQKQCEELLKCLGVPYYYSEGEAEALCAILNEKGIVDGVITQDSDCFLYGAQTVYRNFNISSNSGYVEMYTLASLEEKLSLGRNKLIALSLLCGCDYNDKGVVGIGKESALKFLASLSDSEVLERISSWRDNPLEDDINEDYKLTSKLEFNLKQKALGNPRFPFLDVQEEFLRNNMDVSHITYEWRQPNLKNFVMFTERKLNWTTDYSMEKILPLLSRWHLTNNINDEILELEMIVKKRKLRNVLSYEVKWRDFLHVTIEPLCILRLKYHSMIEKFEQSKTEGRKKRKEGCIKQKNDDKIELSDLTHQLESLSFKEPDPSEEDSVTVSDFECSVSDLLELSSIVESITGSR